VQGYKCIFVMTDKASAEKSRYLKALGADVVITPVSAKPGTPDHYVSTARRIAGETSNSFYPDQYSHPANPEAHYRSTGPGALGTDGRQDYSFRLRHRYRRNNFRHWPILEREEPEHQSRRRRSVGSIYKNYKETGKIPETTPYLVEGIGQEVLPANAQMQYVDEVLKRHRPRIIRNRATSSVASKESFAEGRPAPTARRLCASPQDADADAVIVFIVCDTGRTLPDQVPFRRVDEREAAC
jgi:cystathionine beta-synthase